MSDFTPTGSVENMKLRASGDERFSTPLSNPKNYLARSNSATAHNGMINHQYYDRSADCQEQAGEIKTSYALPTKDVCGNEPANKGTYDTQRNIEEKSLALRVYYLARDESCNEA
jgi:hypothetical protein